MNRSLTILAFSVSLATSAHASNFFDGFDTGTGPDTANWEVSDWANGSPFGCTFAYSEAWIASANLVLNVNSSNESAIKCSEIRTWQSFTYGKFEVRMLPGTIAGADSSFFLYTGTAGTASHDEIDIEFVNSGKTLHTNAWRHDVQNYQDFVVTPGWTKLGFEWRPTYVRWFTVDAAGAEHEFRRVTTSISSPMQLFLNHWNGDNSTSAVNFLGHYNGGGGQALYNWVKVTD